jgi:hypothetical protein
MPLTIFIPLSGHKSYSGIIPINDFWDNQKSKRATIASNEGYSLA